MEKKSINEEVVNEINTLSVEGNAMGFDKSTSPDSFIGIREGEDL